MNKNSKRKFSEKIPKGSKDRLSIVATKRMHIRTRSKVQRQLSESGIDPEEITTEVVDQHLFNRNLDRIISFLPSKFNPFSPKSPGRNAVNRSQPRQIDRVQVPSKRFVSWLTLPQQDASGEIDLTLELRQFLEYVALSEDEQATRKALLEDIEEAVRCVHPDAIIN